MAVRAWASALVGAVTLVAVIGNAAACEQLVRIVGVKRNDVLNMREGASRDDRVIGVIAPDARAVQLCECRKEWCRVRYFDVSGWVHRYYLERDRP